MSAHAITPAQIAGDGQELSSLSGFSPGGGNEPPGERHACSHQAVPCAAARCASQVLDRGAQIVASGAARCFSQELVVLPRPLQAAPLVVHHMYLVLVPRLMFVAPRR